MKKEEGHLGRFVLEKYFYMQKLQNKASRIITNPGNDVDHTIALH